MKKFTQYIAEEKAKKKAQPKVNATGENIEKPYETPPEIRDVQSRWAGDDSITTDWGDHMTAATMAANRGAQSMISREEEDVTPGMASERERSSNIMSSIPANVHSKEIHKLNPTGRQYTDQEIARIMTAQGHPMTKQGAAWIASEALAKLKARLTGSELDPNRQIPGREGGSSPTY